MQHTNYKHTLQYKIFLNTCSFLVPQSSIRQAIRCPSCNKEESREHIGFPCLACQYASIIFQNPFDKCFDMMINTWLLTASDLESGSDESYCTQAQTPWIPITDWHTTHHNQIELWKLRKRSIDQSLDEIRTHSSKRHNHQVFEDLTMLQTTFQDQHTLKSI